MLVIRKEQMEVFEQAALRTFEDQMVEHLKEFAPKHCEVLGESGVRQVVRLGMERARRYGFTNRGPVRFYLESMFLFGSDFDTDPQLPWAGEILKDPTIWDQTVRADRLYDRVMDYLNQVAGPDCEYAKEALRKASRQRFEGVPVSDENFENKVIARLNEVYPQKCAYIGEAALRTLVRRGNFLAERYSVSIDAGVVLFIGLMFALGHGFARDPLFPWIERTLNDTRIDNPNKRVERLHSRAMTYLSRALAYLEQE
jgi:hypothetical protein